MKTEVFKDRNIKLEVLIKQFQQLNFKFMGDLHKYPGSTHYHVTSIESGKTGVVEITFFKKDNVPYLEIKLASNKVGTWGEEGFNLFKQYLQDET